MDLSLAVHKYPDTDPDRTDPTLSSEDSAEPAPGQGLKLPKVMSQRM